MPPMCRPGRVCEGLPGSRRTLAPRSDDHIVRAPGKANRVPLYGTRFARVLADREHGTRRRLDAIEPVVALEDAHAHDAVEPIWRGRDERNLLRSHHERRLTRLGRGLEPTGRADLHYAEADLALELVGPAQKACHERRSGPLVGLLWRGDLLDAPSIHDDDAIGQGHGLGLIVSDQDGGRA